MGGYPETRSFKGKRKKHFFSRWGASFHSFKTLGSRLQLKERVAVGNRICTEYSMAGKVQLLETV